MTAERSPARRKPLLLAGGLALLAAVLAAVPAGRDTSPRPALPVWVLDIEAGVVGATYRLDAEPELRNGGALRRRLRRGYLPPLRDAGVAGSALARFRIDEAGRVDTASVEVVEASHAAFGEAARRVMRDARFRPARMWGDPVPVVVSVPVEFDPR